MKQYFYLSRNIIYRPSQPIWIHSTAPGTVITACLVNIMHGLFSAEICQKGNRFREWSSLELPPYLMLHSFLPLPEKVTLHKMAFFWCNSHGEAPVCLSHQSSLHRPTFFNSVFPLKRILFNQFGADKLMHCSKADSLIQGLPFWVLQGSHPSLSPVPRGILELESRSILVVVY